MSQKQTVWQRGRWRAIIPQRLAVLTKDFRLKTVLFTYFLLRWTRKTFYQLRGRGIFGSSADAYRTIRRRIYGLFFRLPMVRTQIEKQVQDASHMLEDKLVTLPPEISKYSKLPGEGWSAERIRGEMKDLSDLKHTRWEDGYVSGAVYHGGKDLLDVQTDAFGKFTVANPIHPDVFPGVRKMEAEVVAMVRQKQCPWRKDWTNIQHRCSPCSTAQKEPPASQQAAAPSPSSWRV